MKQGHPPHAERSSGDIRISMSADIRPCKRRLHSHCSVLYYELSMTASNHLTESIREDATKIAETTSQSTSSLISGRANPHFFYDSSSRASPSGSRSEQTSSYSFSKYVPLRILAGFSADVSP